VPAIVRYILISPVHIVCQIHTATECIDCCKRSQDGDAAVCLITLEFFQHFHSSHGFSLFLKFSITFVFFLFDQFLGLV